MALPLATTVVSIARSEPASPNTDPTDDAYPAPQVVQSGLRATIATPSASASDQGGTRVVYTAAMTTDPADIRPRDQVTDADGTVWTVLWARNSGAFGLQITQVRLQLVSGVV